QHRHRLCPVAVLRAVVLALDDDTGGQVRDAHRGIGLVYVLSAGAGRAERVDAQFRRIDRDIGDRIGFRQYRDRAGRGMDTTLRFGGRHALHAMAARLELELRVGALAYDAHDHFLEAAELGLRRRHDLDLPAVAFGVTRVHPEEIAGKERRLVSPGAGTNFEEDVAIVVRVSGQQHLLVVA